MPLTACTIQSILPTDNPNEGRVKVNNNFDCLDNTLSSFQINNSSGFTSVSDGSNITTTMSFSGIIPDYTVSVVSDPIFNSAQALSISADTYFLGTTNLANLLSGTSVFTTGSTGSYSIKAINDSTTDATGDYAYAEGFGTMALGIYSHAEGYFSTASGDTSHAEGFGSTASGLHSHAEGANTIASGDYSHAEGNEVMASGLFSHAEGDGTAASGESSHAEGYLTTSIADYSHAGGNNSVASGNTSFIYSTNSFAIGDRSVVLGGQDITGTTNDTVYVPYLNVQSLYSGTSIAALGIDSGGNIVSASTSTSNVGRVLFVSTEGNDSTGEVGNLNKPWRNIYSAKSASTSGDTVYILPGTWAYDNRDSAGNPYNGQIETKVNLWKNGITYYFAPGAQVVFYNQTTTGQIMYLFNPASVSGETCTVLGSLDWKGYSAGPDTSNGHSTFFWAESSNDTGFTFSAEVKKLSSFGTEIYRLNRNVTFTSDTVVANFRLIADELFHQYEGGQTGSGSMEIIIGSDAILNSYVSVRERTKTTAYNMFQITGNFTRSNINFFGDKLIHSGNYTSIFLRSFTGVVNMDIKNMYWYNTFLQTQVSGGGTFNLTGNFNDYYKNNSSTGGVFYLTTANNTINYKGNITTNTGSGIGRYVAATTQPNTINIDGNIQYVGTATTTQVVFQTINAATINYSGKILGTYGGPIAQTYTGIININNSFIKSTIDSSSSKLFMNGTTSQGTFRLNNSYVEFANGTSALSNGSYVKAMINNSTIINTGSANTLSNTTNFGTLQLVNSSIVSSYSGATSIYNTGSTFVVSSNSVVNTNYDISDIRGGITVLTDLIY